VGDNGEERGISERVVRDKWKSFGGGEREDLIDSRLHGGSSNRLFPTFDDL